MLIYDIEIKRAIAINGVPERPGIDYCFGWDDVEGMGISCVCAYDYWQDRYRVFMEDNLAEFNALAVMRVPLVGFNNIKFDNAVLMANGLFTAPGYARGVGRRRPGPGIQRRHARALRPERHGAGQL